MRIENDYTVYDYDRLTPGHTAKIEHNVCNKDVDLSNLLSLTLGEVSALRENNVEKEQAAYKKAIDALKEWESIAAVTGRYERAIEYLKVPEVSHTSNKWVKDEYDRFTISNRVYKMSYDIYERSSWRSDTVKYDVRWSIYTNRPDSQYSYKVAAQERVCSTREEAEKYIQGRIKAYSKLFAEINPPIPKEYEKSFMVYNHLLPGYVTESMQKELDEKKAQKPSVKEQLADLKEKSKEKTKEKSKSEPSKKRNEIEIE